MTSTGASNYAALALLHPESLVNHEIDPNDSSVTFAHPSGFAKVRVERRGDDACTFLERTSRVLFVGHVNTAV